MLICWILWELIYIVENWKGKYQTHRWRWHYEICWYYYGVQTLGHIYAVCGVWVARWRTVVQQCRLMASVGARVLDKGYRHGCLKSGKWQEATKVKSGKAPRCPHVKFDPSSPGPVAKPLEGPRFKIQDFLEVLGQKSWNPPRVSRFKISWRSWARNLGTLLIS